MHVMGGGNSLVAQMGRSLPAMWETRVRSLDPDEPLEKEMATHSSILAWRIPWMKEPGRLQSMGLQKVGHNRTTSLSFLFNGGRTMNYWFFGRKKYTGQEQHRRVSINNFH